MCLRTARIVPLSEGSVKEETIGDAEGVAAAYANELTYSVAPPGARGLTLFQ